MQEKIRFIPLLALVICLIFSCSLQEPVMPSWRVPIVVPLGTERFSFQDEIASHSNIITRDDSLYVNITGEFDPKHITESDLAVPGRDTTIAVEIGVISIDSIKTRRGDSLVLSDAFPELSQSVGQSVTVPETTLTTDPIMIASEDLRGAVIGRCDIKLCITNDLPLNVGPNRFSPGGMKIEVYDSAGTYITYINIEDDIPSGGSICKVKSIAPGDVWIHAPLRLEYALPVSEDTTFVLTGDILDDSSFIIEVAMLDLDIHEIIGRISEQRFTRNVSIAMPGGDRIISGTIFSGSVDLGFHNEIPLSADMDIILPDFTAQGGTPVSEYVHLPPDGYASVSVNLEGVTIASSGLPGSPLDSLSIGIEIETGQSEGFVHITKSDSITVAVHFAEISFSDLEGYLASRSLRIGPFEENEIADYEGFSGGFNFRNGHLMITFQNDLDIENLNLDITIAGYHREAGGGFVDSAGIEIIDQPISTGENTIVLSDGRVVDLLNIFPTDIVCTGSLEYSGYALVRSGEGISGGYSISTPFEIEIRDPEPIEFEPDTLAEKDIDETFRDAAGDDIASAVLHARIVNHSPLGGELLLLVSADPTRTAIFEIGGYATNPKEFIKSIEMKAASVDPATGFVEDAAVSEFSFPLSGDQLSVFKNPPVVTGFQLHLEETAGRVILRGSDFIEISGEVEFEIHIKDEE